MPLQPFKPIQFIPKSRQTHLLSLPIQRIIAAPHHQDTGTNHWCFYLAVSPTTSVQLDCLPTYSIPSTTLPGGSKANVIISELDYLVSPDVEATFTLDLASDRIITVKDIHDLLVENGRHKYEFDRRGVGCRFWIAQQVDLIYQSGFLVDEKQVENMKAAVVKLWPEQTPLELDQGAYYQ
ncbi:hypothetical protein BDW62DRAFT_206047 [Aspergillus aurantiobrunneus]